MASKIHYEEDIFLLKEMLRTLRRGCLISIDSSIFLEYTVNQLLFISKALKELYSTISEANYIKSPEQIRNLLRVSSGFRELLNDLINERLKFSEFTRSYTEDFRTIEAEHIKESARIKELLLSLSDEEENEDLVSEEEFMFLFQDSGDEEE
ncbi:MAG: hypothetical protein PQJ61_02650 [Spirochaetales bacterium]|uniref:Uncharacterized protein n=1 Tax=Candidatus Thalassospirochaeta sargassi TaxID=3119039 RepID=A0AAJ1MJ95_9SPIO|nr:hypothetical protein [Spirochaetales bacterium]